MQRDPTQRPYTDTERNPHNTRTTVVKSGILVITVTEKTIAIVPTTIAVVAVVVTATTIVVVVPAIVVAIVTAVAAIVTAIVIHWVVIVLGAAKIIVAIPGNARIAFRDSMETIAAV